MTRVTCLMLFIVFFCNTKASARETIIATNNLIYDSFVQWTKLKPCEQISNFNSPYANRGTVELIIICQALDVAGYKTQLKLQKYPNYERALVQAKSGKVHLSAETLWKKILKMNTFIRPQQ